MPKFISNPVAASVPVNKVDDPAARQALQHLSDGWSVRNGQTDERFITVRELKDRGGAGLIARAVGNVLQGIGGEEGDIGKILKGIESSIMQTRLWQKLGERIEWLSRENNLSLQKISALQVGITEERSIRQEGQQQLVSTLSALKAQVDENSGAILEEREVRAAADEASATTIQTLDTRVGETSSTLQNFQTVQNNWNTSTAQQLSTLQVEQGKNMAALQTEANIRAEADGKLEAQYTVKVDVNGYVSGYGLASTAHNSTPYSQFIVRADRFVIGSPSGPGIEPVIPFTVNTTTDAQGNPPGVYITSAMIRDLSVDTLKIKGEAITVDKLRDGAVQGDKLLGSNTGVVRFNPEQYIPGWNASVPSIEIRTGLQRRAIITFCSAKWDGSEEAFVYPFVNEPGVIIFPRISRPAIAGVGGSLRVWFYGEISFEWL